MDEKGTDAMIRPAAPDIRDRPPLGPAQLGGCISDRLLRSNRGR